MGKGGVIDGENQQLFLLAVLLLGLVACCWRKFVLRVPCLCSLFIALLYTGRLLKLGGGEKESHEIEDFPFLLHPDLGIFCAIQLCQLSSEASQP